MADRIEREFQLNMTKNPIFIVILGLILLSPLSVSATQDLPCDIFSRNLKYGMTGPDIWYLQKILNKEQKTTVVNSGPGSPGLETIYFGEKTRQAVIRFQEMYKRDVLSPAGLSTGTGIVGALTRAKLSQICYNGESKEQPPQAVNPSPIEFPLITPAPTSTNEEIVQKNRLGKPYIIAPSTYVGVIGATIKVKGSNVPKVGNIVHLDNFLIKNTTIDSRGSLHFMLPSDTPRGIHALWLETTIGTTNKLLFIVTDGKSPQPTVVSGVPAQGGAGTTVTVTGSGFTPTGNQVRIGYGTIKDIPSPDGKTLSFVVSPTFPEMKKGVTAVSIPYRFYIINDNGMSKPLPFTLKL